MRVLSLQTWVTVPPLLPVCRFAAPQGSSV